MKGHIIVPKLNNTGNFVSELDYDKSFIDDSNTKGYFKMLIQPIENFDNKMEIRYMKVENGYKVSGEAYIITGRGEKEIEQKIKKYFEKYTDVLMVEVKSDKDLW
jgi:hypothetical protein